MVTQCYAMVRGSVARFTLLDVRGKPVEGERSVIVTKGTSQIRVDETVDTRGNELLRTDTDEGRLIFRGKNQTIGYTADLELLGVDPDLLWMLTGQPVVENASGVGVGNDATLRLPVVNFAMEVWSKLDRPVEGYTHGYTLFPRLRGGRVRNFQFGNSAVNFSISGARTTRASRWGFGPYSLRWNGGGWDINPWDTDLWDEAAGRCVQGPTTVVTVHERLGTPVTRNLHWRTFLIDHAPVPICGAQSLYDVIDNGDATHTSTDVIDGEFAIVTSDDIIDGGPA